MEGKYLITTDGWFIAPDGRSYCAVWGEVKIVEDIILGIKTNRNSSNWYAKIGNEDNHVIVAGCQIHYAIRCEKKPNTKDVLGYTTGDSGINTFNKPTDIYIADKKNGR